MTHDDRYERTDEQLEAMLQQLEIEKAPASLSSRLYRIPEEESNKGWKWPWQWFSNPMPQWVMAPALAAVPLIVSGRLPGPGPGSVRGRGGTGPQGPGRGFCLRR